VGREQPVHPLAEMFFRVRPDDHVKVVRHQAQGEQIERDPGLGAADQPQEFAIVMRLAEYHCAVIPAIHHVVEATADNSSCAPRHAASITQNCPGSTMDSRLIRRESRHYGTDP